MRTRCTILALALLSTALPAHAVDGVLEINGTCAVQGCFPGDAPGYPVTITSVGSYRLTGHLVTLDKTITAILVQAPNTTIDLNGFNIACSLPPFAPPQACQTGPAAGWGIDGEFQTGVTVRNGTVTGFGEGGVRLGTRALVENIRSVSNVQGIFVDTVSRVSGCVVTDNVSSGITVRTGSLVEHNLVHANGFGLNITPGAAGYRANVFTSNTTLAVIGGHNLGQNYCSGAGVSSLDCP